MRRLGLILTGHASVRRRGLILSGALILGLTGCGAQPRAIGMSRAAMLAALRSSPARLRELHHRAGSLVASDPRDFRALLVGLRGYPIVINEWASWCGNCRFEAPAFQAASVTYGRRVAFVGVNVADAPAAARQFQRAFPMSYPSFADPHQSIARSLQAIGLYPQTLYYNARGEFVIDHGGSYASSAALDRDIERYALH